MKALLMSLVFVASANAFGAAATAYSCVGINKTGPQPTDREGVSFEILFSDWDPQYSFTNNSVTIKQKGWETLETPVTFQLTSKKAKDICKLNSEGEVNVINSNFKMDPLMNGEKGADFEVTFKSNCANEYAYDIHAYCVFQ